jgi:hypothetical protein
MMLRCKEERDRSSFIRYGALKQYCMISWNEIGGWLSNTFIVSEERLWASSTWSILTGAYSGSFPGC